MENEKNTEIMSADPPHEIRWYERQFSLDDAKTFIKANITTAARSFIAIGFYLKCVRDRGLFLEDGYQSVWEFAKAEYGISMSTASRYMTMNDRFSQDGNSPNVKEEYKAFGKSQLQEMLALTDEQLEQVKPTDRVEDIRGMRKTKEIPYIELPGQHEIEVDFPDIFPEEEFEIPPSPSVRKQEFSMDIEELVELVEDVPECAAETQQIEESIAISQQDTLPDMDHDLRREYCEAAAVELIEAEFDWMKADYMNRVLKVDESEIQLKESLVGKGAWYFKDPRGNGIAHVNLFQDCIQFYDEKYWVGDCDWFYLCAAVQSMWNVVALKKAQDEQNNNQDQQTQAWNTNPTPCIHREGYSCTVPETQKLIPGDGSNCGRSCCWECTKRGECKWECNSSQLRPEEPEQVEPEPLETKPAILHVDEDPAPDESWKFGDLPQAKEKYVKSLARILVEKKGKLLKVNMFSSTLGDERIKWKLEDLAEETNRAIEIGDDVIAYPCAEFIEFSRGNEDLGICSYTRFSTKVQKALEEWTARQDSAPVPVKPADPEPVMDAEFEEVSEDRPYTMDMVMVELLRWKDRRDSSRPSGTEPSEVMYKKACMMHDAMMALHASMGGEYDEIA